MKKKDFDLLMREANIELAKYSVGEYRVLRADEESAGRLFHSTGCVYKPKLNADSGIFRFREVFWEKGDYADGTIGRIRHDIVCLCKVISIQEAVLSHGKWDRPHLIVENVATHQQYDFAEIVQGYYIIVKNSYSHASVTYNSPIMPYLLQTHDSYERHPIPFFSKYKRKIIHQPTYIGVTLEPVTNLEVKAHLKHIAVIKRAKIEQQQREKLQDSQRTISKSELDELYRQLDFC